MRCEGMTRHGGMMTIGRPYWEQCKNEAVVMITFEQSPGGYGHTITEGTLPACIDCWKNAENEKEIKIKKVTPLENVE